MSTETLEKWKSIKTKDLFLNNQLSKKKLKAPPIFDTNLSFSDSGVESVMGIGTNKINIHTITNVAYAYIEFMVKNTPTNKKIIIFHDGKNNSKLYSEKISEVIASKGFLPILSKENEPNNTAFLTFAIKDISANGGLMVTSSKGGDNNGIKFLNADGDTFNIESLKEIEKIMNNNTFKFYSSDAIFNHEELTANISKNYINYIKQHLLLKKSSKKIHLTITTENTTTSKMCESLFEGVNINYDLALNKKKTLDPHNFKTYVSAMKVARKNKSDAVLALSANAEDFGVAIKYQKRYKFLNKDQIAALYLEYKLNKLKNQNKLKKDSYIVKGVLGGELPAKIAKNFGVKVIEVKDDIGDIKLKVKETEGHFILAYASNSCLIVGEESLASADGFAFATGIIEMINNYNFNGINLFEHLKSLWASYGIHRTVKIAKKLSSAMTNNLMKRLLKMKEINGIKISDKLDYRKEKNNFGNIIKILLKNGSWIAVESVSNNDNVDIYIQTVGSKKQKLMDVVAFEKGVSNLVDDNTETFENKEFSWKTFFKYILYVLIIAGIMYFVFTTIYSGGGRKTLSDAWGIVNRESRWIWLSLISYVLVKTTFDSWMRKRLIDFQGQKVKIRHLVISSLMGSVISYLTPFAVGGDAIGYWYLRRKGFKRGPLLSSFITTTITWQVGLILQTIILVPIGMPIYKMLLGASDPQSKAAFIMFLAGLSWDVFATLMILSLAFSRIFQEFIVRNSVKLLEWAPFITVQDPGKLSSSYQYEFYEMRKGMRKIWTKKLLLMEIMLYELIPKFISIDAIVFAQVGVIRDGLPMGSYLSQIIAQDVKGTANSFSITPGGSGFSEWLGVTVNKFIFTGDVVPGGSPSDTASSMDLISKIFVNWPMLIISSFMILTVVLGENRRRIHSIRNKNRLIRDESTSSATRFYKIATPIWIICIISILLTFLLI